MSKDAMKLAMEALEHCKDAIVERGLNGSPEFAKKWGLTLPIERSEEAITALREALAKQPAQPQQEPVACERCLELERLCDATYVAQGADAYNHACDEMERWQQTRRKAGKEVGTTGSLCDGISWLYGRIDELEAKVAAPQPPAQQEPVAYMTQARNFMHPMEFTEAEAKLLGWKALYASPPASKPLTDEQAMALTRGALNRFDVVRKTESAHGIKENT